MLAPLAPVNCVHEPGAPARAGAAVDSRATVVTTNGNLEFMPTILPADEPLVSIALVSVRSQAVATGSMAQPARRGDGPAGAAAHGEQVLPLMGEAGIDWHGLAE